MTAENAERGAEQLWSVMYRTGPITPADYQEASDEMAAAVRQDDVAGYGCAICTDTGHTSESCHHNILLAARKWAAATRVYVCYHCGFVATNDEEARDHFGASEDDVAKCTRPSHDTASRAEVDILRGNLATISEEAQVVTDSGSNARTIWLIKKIADKTLARSLPTTPAIEEGNVLRKALNNCQEIVSRHRSIPYSEAEEYASIAANALVCIEREIRAALNPQGEKR